MKLRVFLACLAARLCRAALRMLGRGGTSMPGRVARRLCPDILRHLSRGVQTVLVTGTNGKTTATNMLCSMYDALELPHFTNRAGANLACGLTAAFLANATLTGRPKCRHAVLECDEGALHLVTGQIAPAAIVVTNVFRDQLDRYGELAHTVDRIRAGIAAAPGAVACLNADCPLSGALVEGLENPVRYFGLNVPGRDVPAGVTDAPRCIRCGGAYEYDFRTYAHLGGFRCTDCGYARPTPDVAVTALNELRPDGSSVTFSCGGTEFAAELSLPSVYNVCNAAAVLCAVLALDRDVQRAAAALSTVRAGFGRMELLPVGSQQARIILIKNPAGCDRALDYLCSLPAPFLPVFCLNDQPADGVDISWLWDCDFERFAALEGYERVLLYGSRAEELALRLKYAGLDETRLVCYRQLDALMQAMGQAQVPICLLPNYSAMLEVRERLAAASGSKKFWE